MSSTKAARNFKAGEEVRISKKSWVVDRERKHEGPGNLAPIEDQITGLTGRVTGQTYASPVKDGEPHIMIQVGKGGLLGVPSDRLERTMRSTSMEHEPRTGKASVNRETIEFWRDYFKREDELKALRAELRKKER